MAEQLTFAEVFQKGFANSGPLNSIDFFSLATTLTLAFVLSLAIYYTYKFTFMGVLYSKSFNISLIALAVITSQIIYIISSNLILSLGMVGALSIVRFRTAIKDPIDIVYMFWAITLGITCGAKFYFVAIYATLFLTGVMVLISKFRAMNMPYLLILVTATTHSEKGIFDFLKQKSLKANLRSNTISADSKELTIELRLSEKDYSIVEDLQKIDGVVRASLVSYNGDFVA